MHKIKILSILLLVVIVNSFSQQKKYVSYTVKDGETIKSIAKELDISTRDLLRLNPDIGRKPNVETVIIIPNKLYNESAFSTEKNNDKSDLYAVQPKETLYGISKKFDVSISDLIKANPGLEDGLKIGAKLHIPSKKSEVKPVNEETILHTVVKDNTIYSLTKRYQISEEELFKLNPALVDGLKLGMILKIKSAGVANQQVVKTSVVTNSVKEEVNIAKGATFKEHDIAGKRVNVVFVLPYNLSKASDTINRGTDFSKNSLTSVAADFHLGALMAIDSLKQKGVIVNARFFDSENSTYKLQSIVNNGKLDAADIIIGPLFFDKAEWLTKHTKTSVITPFFSKNQQTYSASNLIKGYPKEEMAIDKLLSHLGRSYKGENVIIINDGKEASQKNLWRVYNSIKAIEGMKEVTVIKPESGYIGGGRISSQLNSLGKNWVFFISEDNVITASAMNNLKGLADKFDITLIALEKGKNFENIDNLILGSLNFMYPSAEFYNMSSKLNKDFFNKFQAKNYAVPSDYAIKGFDITYDTLVRLASSDSDENAFQGGKSIRVASVYNYSKNTSGSNENHGVFIVQYSKNLVPVIIP